MKLHQALKVEELELDRELEKIKKAVGQGTEAIARQVDILRLRNRLMLCGSPLMEAAVLDQAIGVLRMFVKELEEQETRLLEQSLPASRNPNSSF